MFNDQSINDFKNQLDHLADNLESEKNLKFKEIAQQTHNFLTEQLSLLEKRHITSTAFAVIVTNHTKETLKALDKSPTWKAFFTNLLYTIANLFLKKGNQYTLIRSPTFFHVKKFVDTVHDNSMIFIFTTGLFTQEMDPAAIKEAFRKTLKPLLQVGYKKFRITHAYEGQYGDDLTNERNQLSKTVSKLLFEVAKELHISDKQIAEFTLESSELEDRLEHTTRVNQPCFVLDCAQKYVYDPSGQIRTMDGDGTKVLAPFHFAYYPIVQTSKTQDSTPESRENQPPDALLHVDFNQEDGFLTCTEYGYYQARQWISARIPSVTMESQSQLQVDVAEEGQRPIF